MTAPKPFSDEEIEHPLSERLRNMATFDHDHRMLALQAAMELNRLISRCQTAEKRLADYERRCKECGEAYGRDTISLARERNDALDRAETAEARLREADAVIADDDELARNGRGIIGRHLYLAWREEAIARHRARLAGASEPASGGRE